MNSYYNHSWYQLLCVNNTKKLLNQKKIAKCKKYIDDDIWYCLFDDDIWYCLFDLENYDQLLEAEKDLDLKFPRSNHFFYWLLQIHRYDIFEAEWKPDIQFNTKELFELMFQHKTPADKIKWFIEKFMVADDQKILLLAITSYQSLEMIQWIIKQGAHVCTKDNHDHHHHDSVLNAAILNSPLEIIRYFISLDCVGSGNVIKNIRLRTDISFDVQKELCDELYRDGMQINFGDLFNKSNSDEENQYFFDWAFKHDVQVTDKDIIEICLAGMNQFIDKLITGVSLSSVSNFILII